MIKITHTVTNNNPDTIWNVLASKLGREPSSQELREEIHSILAEGRAERAGAKA